MLTFTPFKAGHLNYIVPQERQKSEYAVFLTPAYSDLAASHFSFTGWNGVFCVGAAGLVPVFPHRAMAWMILADSAGAHMVQLVRKIRKVIEVSQYKRVETYVRADFKEGHRFAELIGMQRETPEPMKYNGVDEASEYLYAVTK